MASTTKIMTCILALENQEEGQVVTASAYAAGRPRSSLASKTRSSSILRIFCIH